MKMATHHTGCAMEQSFSYSLISGCFTFFKIIEDSKKLQSKETEKKKKKTQKNGIVLCLQISLRSGLRENSWILKSASAIICQVAPGKLHHIFMSEWV